MNLKVDYCQEEINAKQALLLNARIVLKEEFVGIDIVIDKVLDSLTTWFLFPQLQERPVIINLWGMTGVGKTALVVRLATLLNYDKRFFRYDMGNNAQGYSSLKDLLKGVFRHNNGMPYMLMLDEFQYAKTKNEAEHEIDNQFSRVIWDLLDSGKFQSSRDIDDQIEKVVRWRQLLTDCLSEGIEVANGIVTNNEPLFIDMLNQFMESDMEFGTDIDFNHLVTSNGSSTYTFLPKNFYRELHKCLPDRKQSIVEFKKHLARLNGPQILELLSRAIESAQSNKWVDCTKTVIFILGNLDEAYTMSSAFNPDINANEFHDSSKLININHIKRALKSRFRYEQISRLGNNHIIYPAFSEESFKKIIELELKRVSAKAFEQFGFNLTFSDAFEGLIYAEGVFPTQGTRPVFSTIYQLVETRLHSLVSEDLLKNSHADTIHFDYKAENVRCEFHKEGSGVFTIDEYIEPPMEKLRKPAKDDLQAITAVHESGHAIVTMKAMKILPEYICSTSADVNSLGFMLVKSKWKYFAKDEIIPAIAQLFGGIVAEKIIFGENKVTRGAEEDIERATELAIRAIKDYGMGSLKASISVAATNSKYEYHDNKGEHIEEVRLILNHGYALAEKILTAEKSLLLQLADYLSDERIIKKEQIEIKVRVDGSADLRNVSFIEEGGIRYYRKELKSQVERNIDLRANSKDIAGGVSISLNKKT